MKIITASALAVLALNISASAEALSPAYVNQISYSSYAGSFPVVNTAAIFKPMFEVATTASSVRPMTGNLGLVWQDGDTNTASITQTGSRNVGLIRQVGLNNVASIDQIGSSHTAFISQNGRGNVAVIQQR